MNLHVGPSPPPDEGKRPHQVGAVKGEGADGSGPHRVRVGWVVDTGAEVAVVLHRVAAAFKYNPTGASAAPTSGDAAIMMVDGLVVEFDASGATLDVPGHVGVKSDNVGSNLLGMDKLEFVGASVCWSPSSGTGEILLG